MKKSSLHIRKLVLSAVCLALCLVLPFFTGQIPQIGNMLCPMHIPVLLCGFLCGGPYGLLVGLLAPLLRHVIFGMPPIMAAVPMTFELAAYGLLSGLLYSLLPRKKSSIYIALIGAMLGGRIVWGIAAMLFWGFHGKAFSLVIFWTEAFVNALPGIICHIILIPLLVMALHKSKLFPHQEN